MPSIVTAEQLSKTFQVKVRDPGLRGALRALFRPRYRDVHAVRDVTFRIDPGEIVAFLGPNGAGKTTTLKMLAGLLYPTSGRVEAAGFNPWTGGPPFKRRIALVLGNRQQLVWDLPPEEAFLLKRAIYDVPERDYRERLAELVALLELAGVLQKPVRQLWPRSVRSRASASPMPCSRCGAKTRPRPAPASWPPSPWPTCLSKIPRSKR